MNERGALAAIAHYTFLEAMRNRLLWLVLVLVLASYGLAAFVGSVAITETREFQSGFAGATLRAGAVFTLALFVITSMVREFADKGFELVLSLPVHRATYLLGKLGGFALLALLVSALCALPLLLLAPPLPVLLWALSLASELLLVTALSVLCLLTFSHVTLALSAVAAFYLAARSIAAIQLIAHGTLAVQDPLAQTISSALVDGLAFLLPELHRFTSSSWLIYHDAGFADLLPVLGQTAVYLLVLVSAALFDLHRKNL